MGLTVIRQRGSTQISRFTRTQSTAMKKSRFFAASMAAVSATATTSAASPPSNFTCNCSLKFSLEDPAGSNKDSSVQISASTDKFAPRFDGLRFIETLVTAHR